MASLYKIKFMLFVLLLLFSTNLLAEDNRHDVIKAYGDINIPSLKFDDINAVVSSNKTYRPKLGYGGGLMYNSLRLGISTFQKGFRYTGTYHFLNDSAVSPYLGVSYIHGSKVKYFMEEQEFNMDHTDFIVGLSGNILGHVHPYIEYEFLSTTIMFGLRISISYNLNKN